MTLESDMVESEDKGPPHKLTRHYPLPRSGDPWTSRPTSPVVVGTVTSHCGRGHPESTQTRHVGGGDGDRDTLSLKVHS